MNTSRPFINVPCKGCEHRYPGCHAVCIDYSAYRHNMNLISEKIIKEKRLENDLKSVQINSLMLVKVAKHVSYRRAYEINYCRRYRTLCFLR